MRRAGCVWKWVALAGMACAWAAAAAAQDVPAPRQVEIDLDGAPRAVDVHRPAGVPRGVAVIAHGFTRSRVRHGNLGRALAEGGIVAVIPDLPNVLNLWANGEAVVELVARIERGEVTGAPVQRAHVVLVGTSAGGLATVLAAARLPGIGGWIGLDPVDRTGTGAAAAREVTAPGVVMLADPSLCNLVTSGEAIAAALPQRLRTLAVAGASHCDFEDPTNTMCEVACGRSSQELRETIRSEIVATVQDLLARAAAPPEAVAPVHHAGAPTAENVQ